MACILGIPSHLFIFIFFKLTKIFILFSPQICVLSISNFNLRRIYIVLSTNVLDITKFQNIFLKIQNLTILFTLSFHFFSFFISHCHSFISLISLFSVLFFILFYNLLVLHYFPHIFHFRFCL